MSLKTLTVIEEVMMAHATIKEKDAEVARLRGIIEAQRARVRAATDEAQLWREEADDADRARKSWEESHAGQKRNTLAFMEERDEAIGLLRELYDDLSSYANGPCAPGSNLRERIEAVLKEPGDD
jgi:hypothetical protein